MVVRFTGMRLCNGRHKIYAKKKTREYDIYITKIN